MILHPYTHGDAIVANYYGHGFGSIFARLFSKVAAKTASRAALSASKRVGSRLVKTGVRKVLPIAKKTLTSVVKTEMKIAVPVPKKDIQKRCQESREQHDMFAPVPANIQRSVHKSGPPRKKSPKGTKRGPLFSEIGD